MKFRFEFSTTNLLITINVVVFGLASFLGLAIGTTDGASGYSWALDFFGAASYSAIAHGEVWRMITAIFLHANIFHLFVNMYALYALGMVFERYIGGKKLFTLYIFAGIGGSLLSLFFNFTKVGLGVASAENIPASVGASGALFGILGFFLVTKDIAINKGQVYSILLLNLFIGFLFAGLIDNWAHIGGLMTGVLFGLFNNRYQFKKNLFTDLFFVLAVLIFFLSYLSLISYNLYIILYK